MKLDTFVNDLAEAIQESEIFEESFKRLEDFGALLTNNKGLIVHLKDGSEYQLTIVPGNSKANEEDDED